MVMTTTMGEALRERLTTLWRKIEDAHYSYLETDDSPEKEQKRKKLEAIIKDYLLIVPASCKFGLPVTAAVFARTVRELPDFSAYRAGLGWAALARYAANLLTQPWRTEYKTIRLYCGFYKHEVEANVVGADAILSAMGYVTSGSNRMSLSGPVCPDTVASISRDAMIASVECQIMCEMWEATWAGGGRASWQQVARDRRYAAAATGSEIYSNVSPTLPPQIEPHRNRLIDTRFKPQFTACQEEMTVEEPIQPMIQPQYVMPPVMYQMPPQMHEVPVTVPMMTPYGVPYYYPAPYMIPTPVYTPLKQTTVPINGYPPISQYRYPAVPTAQLIELDATSAYDKHEKHRVEDRSNKKNKQDCYRRNSTSRSGFSDVTLPSLPRSDTQPALSKAREDGMGTYESWDYVFRNLSSKDQDDSRNRYSPSFDRDSRTLDRLDRDEKRSKFQPTTLDLEDGLQALNLDRSHDEDLYRTAKVNENLMRLKQEQEQKRAKQLKKKELEERKVKRVIEPVENPPSDGLMVNKVAPDKVKLLTKKDIKDRKDVLKQQNSNGSVNGLSSHADLKKVKKTIKSMAVDVERQKSKPVENGYHGSKSSTGASTSQPNYDLKSQLIVSLDETDFARKSPPKTNGERAHSRASERETQDTKSAAQKRDGKWECSTCTYLNKTSCQVCEMCGKSKKGPEIQPLTSGGKECPACTLVNKREARVCDACGTGLEHCPTYI